MVTAEIISISVVVLISAAELLCLYLCSRTECRGYPLCVIIPVRRCDTELEHRLDCIGSLISDGSPLIGNVCLLNIDPSEEQLEICDDFCQRYAAAEIVLPNDIVQYMNENLPF